MNFLPGRETPVPVTGTHVVLKSSMIAPFATGHQSLVLGLGCFWGAERIFWQLDGVLSTAVGYAGGATPNPSYEEVCSGQTGHTEVVLVIFDPKVILGATILNRFFESHDPTQGMRQGGDIGTQYRSAIYVDGELQLNDAQRALNRYQKALDANGYGAITTEVDQLKAFYYAEDYHQQYLAKNPGGYCGLGGTGISCSPEAVAGKAISE